MKPLFPEHRAAEEFDSALEGRASTAVADRYADLLALRDVLAETPQVRPRPEFSADLRSRLMLAAEADLVAAPPVVRRAPRTNSSPTRRRVTTAVAAVVLVGGTAGMAAAANGSLPGQGLYPIKRGTEQVGTVLHLSDAAKGNAQLGHAGTRLDEVAALLRDGSGHGALVASTVDAFRSEAADGSNRLFSSYQASGDAADVTDVRDFTAAQMDKIAVLAPGADAGVAGSLRDAADLLADIDQQARTLCRSCSTAGAVLPPAALASAAAASVDSLISRPVTRASMDARSARKEQAAELRGAGALSGAAQQAAGELNSVTDPASPVGQVLIPDAGKAGGAVGDSDVGGDTVPLPAAGVKTAVGGLVTGVTGTLGGATSSDPVSGAIDGVKDGLKKTTDGLTQAVGGATGGLVP